MTECVSVPDRLRVPRSRIPHARLMIPLLASVLTSTAMAQSNTLEMEIQSLSPNYYWTLESSLWSQTPSGTTNSITFDVYEKDAASINGHFGGTVPVPSVFMEVDYLPILPAHMNAVPGSNAAILGESSGALAGATRGLELTYSEFGDEPTDALGMESNYEWTMHLMVSPDLGARSAETLFHVGDSNDFVKLEVDVDTSTTTYTIYRRAQGVTKSASVTVTNSTDPRQWDQVVANYDTVTAGSASTHLLNLNVNGNTDSITNLESLAVDTSGSAVVGIDNTFASGAFHGAVHHMAIWDRTLSPSEISDLASSVTVAPAPRTPLEIDWEADVRFHTWSVPWRTTTLISPDRNLLNWNDPIWERDGMYPMVRFRSDYNNSPKFIPPGATAPTTTVQTSQIAQATYLWIDYIEDKLPTPKSLTDGPGYSIYWQTLFNGGTYLDYNQQVHGSVGRAKSITRNWRDAPAAWREDPSAGLQNSAGDPQDSREVNNPFFREGMSQNAYRMSAILRELNELLNTSAFDPPERLHLDIEKAINFYQAVGGINSNGYHRGWAEAARTDPRSSDPAHWSPFSVLPISILDDGMGAPTFNANANYYYGSNIPITRAFGHFGRIEYEYSLYNAVMAPAIRYLNEDIRVSEYRMIQSGSSMDESDVQIEFVNTVLDEVTLNYFDFSSPVCYPLKLSSLPSGPSLDPWADRLGIGYLNTDGETAIDSSYSLAEITQDLDWLFLEKAKHNLSASYLAGNRSLPTAPWIIYPGHTWGDLQSVFTHLPTDSHYRVRWQEVARMVVFGYRRGVREFLWWGEDRAVDIDDDDSLYSDSQVIENLEGMEEVLDALENAKDSICDMTSTGHTDRGDSFFGIPDGTINNCDYDYFIDRLNELDLEADVAGVSDSMPDGQLTIEDWSYFLSNYSSAGSCP